MDKIISTILLVCFIRSTIAELSPVFLWNSQSSASKPSLMHVHKDEFAKLVHHELASKALVLFLENNLTVKDFSCGNTIDGESCFARLQGVTNKTYYPAVENPIESLRPTTGEISCYSINTTEDISKILKTDAGTINCLRFDDEKESNDRETRLQLHDSIIATITSQLGKNVFFMYASAPSETSLSRRRRQTSGSSHGYVFRDNANLLFYYKSISIIQGKSVNELEIKSMTVKLENDTAISVVLTPTTGSPLTFDVVLAGGYFFMKNVMYNNVKFLSSEVYAPTDFSYFCGNLSLNNIPSESVPLYTLKLNYLQFQAPFGHTKNTSFPFGDAWHCVGFFTGGILSGLLIVALLLTITFVGVCWMMDINTMDRFDDPKGKTITISASD